jgi:hypothetical protein
MLPRRKDVVRPRPGGPSAASVKDIAESYADYAVVPFALTAHPNESNHRIRQFLPWIEVA